MSNIGIFHFTFSVRGTKGWSNKKTAVIFSFLEGAVKLTNIIYYEMSSSMQIVEGHKHHKCITLQSRFRIQ